jgi:hypothetical protein
MTKRYYKYGETHRTVKGRKQKYCTKCKKWKGESEFGVDRAKRDGLNIRCKDCYKAYTRALHKKYTKGKKTRAYLRYEACHRIVRGIKEKLCSRCKQWKYESDFYRHRRLKDGLSLRCRECESKRLGRKTKGGRRSLRYEDSHRLVNGVKEKLCNKCRKWKTESEYHKHRATKDGLASRCKKCSYKPRDKFREKR